MKTVRYSEINSYEAPKHHGMSAFLLQGLKASENEHFWCGLSIFLPAGGAEKAASATEKVYVVLSGEITVITDEGTTTLSAFDSCRIAPNEERIIENRSRDVAKMLVISASAKPGDGK
ncbi:MAG: cupin domain-containing protein [SAR324 cluster bacterium]|nr:cupin domain-containing protein [SAR324 cluster bacterium]